MKEKLINFQTFQKLKTFQKHVIGKKEKPESEDKLKQLVSDHFSLLFENISLYFPQSLTDECKQ